MVLQDPRYQHALVLGGGRNRKGGRTVYYTPCMPACMIRFWMCHCTLPSTVCMNNTHHLASACLLHYWVPCLVSHYHYPTTVETIFCGQWNLLPADLSLSQAITGGEQHAYLADLGSLIPRLTHSCVFKPPCLLPAITRQTCLYLLG